MPSAQNWGGPASIAGLRNPYNWTTQYDARGLFGRPTPQYPSAVAPGMGEAPYTGAGGMGAAPGAPGTAPGAAPGAGGAPADMFGAAEGGAGPGFGGALGASSGAFTMIGDMSPPIFILQNPVGVPPTGVKPIPPPAHSTIVPSVREFKIAENQSPIPQDRVFFGFNYYNNVNRDLNKVFDVPFHGVQIYRYTSGFEKTFNQGMGSFGLWLPLNNVFARRNEANVPTGGDSTALGNLTIFLKHVLAYDSASGSLASAGIAVSPRTAPRPFAGAPFLLASNTTTIQPFFGYFLNSKKVYLQGFEAIDVPADANQPTMIYNDVGIGYYLYTRPDQTGFVRAIIPTFEVHANIPLNHRSEFNRLDRFGTPDVVNLTYGVNFRLLQRSTLTWGFVNPVTGPKPFAFETTLLLNIYYGRTARRIAAPPIIGG